MSLSRERVERIKMRLEFAQQPGRVMIIDEEEASDLLAILRDYQKQDKAGVADETGRGVTRESPVPTRGEGANPSPGLSSEDEGALADARVKAMTQEKALEWLEDCVTEAISGIREGFRPAVYRTMQEWFRRRLARAKGGAK